MSLTNSPDAAGEPTPVRNTAVPLPYSLFENPPYLVDMRQRFFDPKEPFRISYKDFKTYWPFVDNVYTIHRTPPATEENDTKAEFYPCRIRQSQASLEKGSPAAKQEDSGKQTRRKRQKIEETCPMILKVTTISDGPEPSCIVERADPNIGHMHDLEYSDNHKRNSAIMEFARREAIKGFTPISVFNQMQAETDNMAAAGGKFMKVSDVRNSTIKWRAENPDLILKTHEGVETKPRKPRQSRTSEVNNNKSQQQLLPLPPDTLRYPSHAQAFLLDYLPNGNTPAPELPFIMLTYATSLDARLSATAGTRTVLSGPESKAMTHFLRSKHDAILIGVGTALADNPSLNCRIEGVGGYGLPGLKGQPRPIIIDPHGRLPITPNMKVLELARSGQGRPPWIVVAEGAKLNETSRWILNQNGGAYIQIRRQNLHGPAQPGQPIISWYDVFTFLANEGIKSVMVEGGGTVVSELLRPMYRTMISSVVVTVAPTYLGTTGTPVVPDTLTPSQDPQTGRAIFAPVPNRLTEVKWQPMGNEDVILCGKLGTNLIKGPASGGRAGILNGIEELAQEAGGPPGLGTASSATPHPNGANGTA